MLGIFDLWKCSFEKRKKKSTCRVKCMLWRQPLFLKRQPEQGLGCLSLFCQSQWYLERQCTQRRCKTQSVFWFHNPAGWQHLLYYPRWFILINSGCSLLLDIQATSPNLVLLGLPHKMKERGVCRYTKCFFCFVFSCKVIINPSSMQHFVIFMTKSDFLKCFLCVSLSVDNRWHCFISRVLQWRRGSGRVRFWTHRWDECVKLCLLRTRVRFPPKFYFYLVFFLLLRSLSS